MNRKIIILILIVFASFFSVSAQKIKVACVGNSVTFGSGIKDKVNDSYPAQLQELLSANYEVANFGHSGATMLKNGHKPYWEKPAFTKSKEFEPNIVIIHLGLNDQGNNNWPLHKDEFVQDYLEMIQVYQSLSSQPKVFICRMSPTFSGHRWFEKGMRESFKEIQIKIEEVAESAKVDLIDLHEPLYRFPEYFPDNLHPTKEGAKIIAQKAFSAITGNFGGLRLPLLYGENMVFQRNEPIIITGTANANDVIKVTLNGKKASTSSANNGAWRVSFPAMKAGGPYKLSFNSKLSEDIHFKTVYVGEVWLASGQSNMAFGVKSMASSETVLKDSINSNIHLFHLDRNISGKRKFTKEDLQNCNTSSYFKTDGWQTSTSENIGNFSAIAYAFAYNLQKELNVPIGIICNAAGGSTTQSWISRESMEQNHQTIDLLNDNHLNPMVLPWVYKRKAANFKDLKKYNIKARHPFDPTMLFDAGIQPIKNFNIKGVLWYQGESNADQVSFHSTLFEMLVNDWRMHWNKPNMPFYFVQLSSINRPTWGHFRDAQRRLLDIPNTGMAVSSDVGHPTNVHPKKKWIVGTRLSAVSLAQDYNKNNAFSGPLLDFVNVIGNTLEVHFSFGNGLKTSDGKAVTDIQIAGSDKIFVEAKANIENDVLTVWSDEVKTPRYVKYAYSPYTEGNLVNENNFPASTFSNLIK